MQLIYNSFALHNLGDFTVSQEREYEGDSPQRARVTFKVKVELFETSYADNYDLLEQLRVALRTQHAELQWTNTEVDRDYVKQTARLVSENLPEEWGEYYQTVELVFEFFDHSLTTNNLPLVFTAAGSSTPLTLTHVTKWTETTVVERFSPLHSERARSERKLAVSGIILGDLSLSLAARRAALKAKKDALDQLDSKEGVLQFGTGVTEFFNRTVRVDEITAEVDEATDKLAYSFSAHYIRFPVESNYATVELDANERDANTGEQFLELSGRILATDEATARAKLAAMRVVMLAQYGYSEAQPLRQDTVAKQLSANEDGDAFLELTFNHEFRKWRATNGAATFLRTGGSSPVGLDNVRLWTLDYSRRDFNELRSQRQAAGGRIDASGTFKGDPSLSESARRTALIAQAVALEAEINHADGTLVYGAISKVVRVQNFRAEVNQAITGIDWSLTASYTNFPDEAGYATTEFSVTQRAGVEDGDAFLLFAGRILAPDETLARAKLTALRATVLAGYSYSIEQQLRQESSAASVYANGDKTAGLSAHETVDGTTFTELTFSEEYRKRNASLVNWTLRTSAADDTASGLIATTYSGYVIASGSTVNNAYTAALAQAQTLGAGKESTVGGNAFLKRQQINWEKRQTQASNAEEFVRLEFSYEYQSKIATGRAYLEVTSDSVVDPFGVNTESVSGFVVAVDFSTAQSIYLAQVRDAYNGLNIRGERTSQAKVMAQIPGGSFTTQQIRLDFSFQIYTVKASGKISYRYGISITRDFLSLEKSTRVHGSVFAESKSAAETALDTLLAGLTPGSQLRSERNEDREYTSDSADVFVKLDFDEAYVAALTGVSGLLEMKLSEKVQYSGPRWVVQPTLEDGTGAGGYDVPQSVSKVSGNRRVEGYVSGADRTECEAWARLQRALLTGDADGGHYPQPPELDADFEFVPRIDGIAAGSSANVRLYRVSFAYAEILPNYPEPV